MSTTVAPRLPGAASLRVDAAQGASEAERRAAARERDDVALLGGPEGGELVRAVLEAEGVDLVDWSTHRIEHRPGVGVTVGWTATWRSAHGHHGQVYLLATTCPVADGPAMTTVRIGSPTPDDGGRTVQVWRHPFDPALPGLAAASAPASAAALLGLDPARTTVELVTYRPLRRSVLRVAAERTVYLKVVRPHTAGGLLDRHRLLRAAGLPAARATEPAPGVLALDQLPGRPLTDALAATDADLVQPTDLLALLDRLPAAVCDLPRRAPVAERVADHTRAAAAAIPDRAAHVLAVGVEIGDLVATSDAGPVVPSHGDLHSANLMVDQGDVVGLLDVDQVGPGHRVDDLACLLAHLSVLPVLAPSTYLRVPGVLVRWIAAFDEVVDPVALRVRAAAVVLSLVAGARRDGVAGAQQADAMLAVAEDWLTAARCLRDLSSSRPAPLTCRPQAEQHHQGRPDRRPEQRRRRS